MATLEGLILSHHFMAYLEQMDGTGFGSILADFWYLGEIGWNMLDDSMVIALSLVSFMQHKDLYNVGLLLGKTCKILIQFYLEGNAFQKHKDFNF